MKHCCAVCQVEYQANIQVCPECGRKLVAFAPDSPDMVSTCAIYAVAKQIEETHIISELKKHGLRVRQEKEELSQLPSASDDFIIAVHPRDVKKALEHIRQMRQDGIIAPDGVFLA